MIWHGVWLCLCYELPLNEGVQLYSLVWGVVGVCVTSSH